MTGFDVTLAESLRAMWLEAPEGCAQVFYEQVGRLKSSEVAAAFELGPMHDCILKLGEAAYRQDQVVRENSYAQR